MSEVNSIQSQLTNKLTLHNFVHLLDKKLFFMVDFRAFSFHDMGERLEELLVNFVGVQNIRKIIDHIITL